MFTWQGRIVHCITCVLLLPLCIPLSAQESRSELLFVRRVWPLLQSKCLPCHGGDVAKIEGGLDLRTNESAKRGGDSEVAVVLMGDPGNSPLYLASTREHSQWSAMPPKEAEGLTQEQLDWLRDWIASGADWPDAQRVAKISGIYADDWSTQDGIMVATSGGLSADWTNRKYKREGLWAYQPLWQNKSPNFRDEEQYSLDRLVRMRMPRGLNQAPRADRRSLIRRATYDLTGLPPTPADVRTFVTDPRSDSIVFSELVERLLKSPHYGEHMAQHWLDVVRYADSSGFANDFERGNAWRYRDYVVRAFNNDKPYDQFIREQIAGDEINSEDPEMLIATGFLRMGPWELTGMEVAKVARQRFLDDVTNSVSETFLAHSLQCARCHDHKFDPVPTRDYYAIQAVFATTQLTERPAPFLPEENLQGFEEKRFLEMRRDACIANLTALDLSLLENAKNWFGDRNLSSDEWDAAVIAARNRERQAVKKNFEGIFNAARNALTKRNVAEALFPPKFVGFTAEQFGNERVARKGLERLNWEFERYDPIAFSVYSGRTPDMKSVVAPLRIPAEPTNAGELEKTCILTGGDPFAPGAPVLPGVLSVIKGLDLQSGAAPKPDSSDRHKIPSEIEGRRRALADWIASRENPLTARVIVNRVWMWHFNQPIAGNPNNFGSSGKRPTHPELLDWLARDFMESGYSFKHLHRRIMTSDTYCSSAEHQDRNQLQELDPLATSFAVFKPRRLTAEELRDSMLAVSDELNLAVGGIPNRPEINLEAALQPRQVMGTFAAAWSPNPRPEQRHRRSLYSLKLRGLPDPMLEVFNSPTSDFSCECRETSSVTPQAFSLFNGQSARSRALAIAKISQMGQSDAMTIANVFARILSRSPSKDEEVWCLRHWSEVLVSGAAADIEATSQPLEVRRDAVEENTGERFSFIETMHSNTEFVPDLQPADVDAKTRALADICLVLLNSNEFVFVY